MEILQSELSFSQNELIFIRQCIDLSTISAKDAKFVANIQNKLDSEIQQMLDMLNQQEAEKRKQLDENRQDKIQLAKDFRATVNE